MTKCFKSKEVIILSFLILLFGNHQIFAQIVKLETVRKSPFQTTYSQFYDNGNLIINKKNNEGVTLIHLAAKNNDISVLQEIAQTNTNLEVVDNCGASPLLYAVNFNSIEAINILLKSGADLFFSKYEPQKDMFGSIIEDDCTYTKYSPAKLSIINNSKSLFKNSINEISNSNLKALIGLSIQLNNLELVNFFLKNSPDSLIQSFNPFSFVLEFSPCNNFSKLQSILNSYDFNRENDPQILSKGLKPWVPTEDKSLCKEALRYILETSPSVTVDGSKKNTLNYFPAILIYVNNTGYIREDIISILLEEGADINAQNKDGNTPLFLANRSEELTSFLIRNGADVNHRNNNLEYALEYQMLKGYASSSNSVRMFCSKGATYSNASITRMINFLKEKINDYDGDFRIKNECDTKIIEVNETYSHYGVIHYRKYKMIKDCSSKGLTQEEMKKIYEGTISTIINSCR